MNWQRAIRGKFTIAKDCKGVPPGGLGQRAHRVLIVLSEEGRWITSFEFFGEGNMMAGETREAQFIPITDAMIDKIPAGMKELPIYAGNSFVGTLEVSEIVTNPEA